MLKQSLSTIILLHLFPRLSIEVCVQVLHNDGSLLSAAFSGACLALIDAGIPLSDIMTGVSCVISKDGSMLVDPTLVEEEVM